MKIICLSTMLFFILSFQMKGQNGYVKYQTFDEYKMEGVGEKKIRHPYVLVKKEADTIFVKRSDDIDIVTKYINRGDHWYTKQYIGSVKMTYIIIREKFIYNNTIIEFEYMLYAMKKEHNKSIYISTKEMDNGIYVRIKKLNNGTYRYDKELCLNIAIFDSLERINSNICIHTKNEDIYLSIKDEDITNYANPYNEIKELVANYKEILPQYISTLYQPRYYRIYEKHIEGKFLSIYEIDEENKKFISSKKMNRLGEFDNRETLSRLW